MKDFKYIETNKLINLDELFVVVKRYAGNVYYLREKHYVSGYLCDSKYAGNAVVFSEQSKAQEICDKINATRKKIKLQVESASMHFASNIELSSTPWFNKTPVLTNRVIAVQDFSKAKPNTNIKFTEQLHKAKVIQEANIKRIKEDLERNEEHLKRQLQEAEEWYKDQIQNAKDYHASQIKQFNENLEKAKGVLKELEQVNFEEIKKSVETDQDKKFQVLFGSDL